MYIYILHTHASSMNDGTIFKRKIYRDLLKWKDESSDRYALMIEGARRVGKTTVVREFAINEYKSHIIIDFSKSTDEIRDLFKNHINDLDVRDGTTYLPIYMTMLL